MVNGVHGVPGPIVPSPVAVEDIIEQGVVTVLIHPMLESYVQALLLILNLAIQVRVLLVMQLM